MLFETERCTLRPMTMADADEMHIVLSDPEVMRYIEPVFDRGRVEMFIREAGMCEPPLVYAVVWRETGRVIGHAVFHGYGEDAYEIGWILNREYWGRGIANELTGALVKQARAMRAAACVIEFDPRQEASRRIALRNGFSYEGLSDGLEVYRLALR